MLFYLVESAQAGYPDPQQAVPAALPALLGPQCAALAMCLVLLPRTLLPHRWQLAAQRRRPRLPPAAIEQATARLHILCGLLSLLSNTAVLLLKSDASRMREPGNAAITVLSFLILGVPMTVVPALWPALFTTHRRLILACTRLAYFALPTIRDPRAASNILKRQPSDSRLGLAIDLWTLHVGSRTMAQWWGAVLCPLPLLPHLLLAAYAFQRCRTTEHMCSLPLLTSPTWQRRIAWVHRALNALPLVMPGAPYDSGSEMDCRVFLSFFQLSVGLVLSTLCLEAVQIPWLKRAGAWPEDDSQPGGQPAMSAAALGVSANGVGSSSYGAPRDRDSGRLGGGGTGGDGSGSGSSSSGGGTSGSGGASSCGWAAHATSYLRWLAEEAEARVEELCCVLRGGSGSRVLTAAGWAMLLSLLWMCAMLLEGRT